MRNVARTIALLSLVVSYLNGQGGDRTSLQQRVGSEFSLTEVTRNRSAVVNKGTVLTLHKDNLLLYSTACPSSPQNTYRSGRLAQSFGGNVLRDLGGSMRMPGNSTTANCPQRRFTASTQLWVTKIDVDKNGIVFHLYATPENDSPYYGDLKFPFEKGSVPAPDEALRMISEVLTVEQVGDAANRTQPAQTPSEKRWDTPSPVVPLRLPATYANAQTPADKLQLNADNTFFLQEGGQNYSGTFSGKGSAIELNIRDGPTTTLTVQGNKLTDSSGQTWVSVQ